jgi:hypothetical protein
MSNYTTDVVEQDALWSEISDLSSAELDLELNAMGVSVRKVAEARVTLQSYVSISEASSTCFEDLWLISGSSVGPTGCSQKVTYTSKGSCLFRFEHPKTSTELDQTLLLFNANLASHSLAQNK